MLPKLKIWIPYLYFPAHTIFPRMHFPAHATHAWASFNKSSSVLNKRGWKRNDSPNRRESLIYLFIGQSRIHSSRLRPFWEAMSYPKVTNFRCHPTWGPNCVDDWDGMLHAWTNAHDANIHVYTFFPPGKAWPTVSRPSMTLRLLLSHCLSSYWRLSQTRCASRVCREEEVCMYILSTYIHTNMHTYIHTYIHTYTYIDRYTYFFLLEVRGSFPPVPSPL